jgi:hypothetical protein
MEESGLLVTTSLSGAGCYAIRRFGISASGAKYATSIDRGRIGSAVTRFATAVALLASLCPSCAPTPPRRAEVALSASRQLPLGGITNPITVRHHREMSAPFGLPNMVVFRNS